MSVGQLFNRFVAVWFIALLTSAAAMAQPVFNAVVSPGTVGAGNLSTLTYTIDNSGSASIALDATFSTTLPAGMTFQGDPEVDTDCVGAVVSAPSGGTTLSFADADIAAGSLCQIVLNVAASSSGTITSGDLTSILGNSGPASTTLTVNADQVTFDKSFSPASVSLGGKSTLTFTITNPSASVRVGNLDFVDTLPVGMEVASPANATTDCVGGVNDTTLTAVPGTDLIQLDANGVNYFAGLEVLPVSSSCTVTVDVKATAGGDLVNSTSLQADFVDVGSAQDTLSVTVAALNLAKSFLINPANAGGTTELEFTINNFNRFDSATGVAFSDDLDAALSGLTYDSLLSNTCGGTVGGTGTSTISFTGGTVPAADLCKIKVALAVPGGAVGGSYPNTTSTITGTVGAVPVTGNAATDTLFIPSGGSAPTLAFEILEDGTFAADPVISAGDDIVLRYTITNTSTTDAASDVGVLLDPIPPLSFPLTATLPAAPCGAGSSIGFVFPGTEDQGIELTGGSLAIGASCTFDVVLTTPGDLSGGTYTLVTEPVTATLAGGSVTGLNDSDSFVVGAGADVVFNKTFASSAVPGGTVSLTFDIVTGAESAAVSALSFTDDLNAMLTGATATGLPISACGGTLSGSAGNTLLTFTGGALAGAGDSCTIPVTLNIPASAAVGTYTNTTSDLSGSVSGTVFNFGSASDDLSVAGLNFTKEFVDTPVIAGETTTLRFSIENVHPTDDATITVFTDNLAANLSGLAATGPASTDTCGGSLSGTTFLIYTGGSVLSGQTCIIEVEVLVPASAPDGSYANVTSSLSANMGGAITVDPATATLEVQSNLITLTKSFTDGPVSPGGAVTLEFTLTNEDATRAASAIAFSDNLDSMLSGTIIDSVLSNSCGGSFSGTGTDSFIVSGVALASGASCTITTSLTIPGTAALGTVVNTTSDVTATIGGFNVTGDAASDTLEVAAVVDLMFSKSFADVGVPAGGSTVLSLSVVNTGSGAVSGISFTDDLDAMLSGTVATGHAASAGCGGGGTFSGSGFLTASGYSVAVGQTCTLTATVTVPGGAGLGNYSNTTSQLFVSGVPTASAASDTLVVVPAPTFTKDFADPTIAAGFATTMTLTVDNSAAIIGASSLDVTDNLPAGMVVAATPNASTTCTGGTLTAASGSGTVSYSGGAVAASASCIIAVDVTAATAGALVNTTGDLTSSLGNSGSASDTLTVVLQPAFTKAFSPASISLGQSSTLTFTIDNTGSGLAATSISFIDTLPANLVVAPTPNASTTCTGGTLSATGGAGTLSYTGGSLAGASSCTVNVDVVPTAAGALNNLTGDLTSSLGNSGPASATLTVISPEIDISGSVGGAVADGGTLIQGTLDAGVQQTLTLTISNTGSDVLTLAPSPVSFGLTNVVVDSVTGPLSTSVAIGSSTTVTILYTPAAAIQTDPTISQPFSFNLSLGSNDVDEAVYDIQVSGTAQDATAPAGYTAAFDQDPVNGANQTGVSFTFAAAEVGADFAYSIASDGGGAAITGTGTIATATDQVTGIDVSALGDGTLTLTVALTDVPGNTGANATDTTTKDATAPAGYTVAFDQDPVNGANQTGVSFTFAAAEVGAGYAYSIASDGGGAAITGTGTIVTATDQVTGIDVSALGNGTLTLTVALTDVPGNTGANATDTTTKDATAPAGYTVAFDQDPVNGANQAAMSFTFAGAEVGAGYAYSIASDGGGAAVTGTGTIATITDVIGGLDLSGLSDGTLTLTVTLTDVAGNTGVEATDTVGKDTVAPALAINTPLAGDGLISAAEASAVIVSGTSTDLADGATVNIAVADGAAGSVTGTATVTGGVWTTTLNLSALADGALALTADAVDAASNPAPQATASATLDTVAPTGYTAAFDQDPVNLSNQTAIDITVSGAEVGATVALRIESDGGASLVTPGTVAAATATVNVTGLDLSSLDDGTLTVSAILIDPAGNAGAVVTGTATKDTDAPSLAIDSPLAGDDVINAAEAAAVTVSGTSTGLADGAVVTVNATDTGVGLATGTATVAGGVWTLSLDVTGLTDGALNLTANASDAGGNPAPQATATATKDADVPVVTIDGPIAVDDVINGAEAASFAVSGAATGVVDGTIVRLILRDGSSTAVYYREAPVSAGSWSLTFDIAALADGDYELSADVTDLAGNPAVQATASLTKDTTAPTIEILDPAAGANAFYANAVNAAEAAAFTASGTALNAADAVQVVLTATDGAAGSVSVTTGLTAGPAPAHSWTDALDLSSLGDGTITLTAVVSDAAGNSASTSTSFLKDTVAPTGYSATLDQDPVNIANTTAVSFTFADAEVGPGAPGTDVTFAYSIASDGGGAPVTGTGTIATATDQVTGIDLSSLPDGTLTFTVTLTDFKGNTGDDATDTAIKDATAPSLAFDAPLAGDDVVNGAEAASTVISGTSTDLLDGAMVNVSVSDAAAGLVTGVATVTGGAWSVSLDLASLADGTLGLTADASDAAGNPAPQAIASMTKDVVAPAGYSATLDQNPINGGNQTAVSFTFAGAEVGASFAYTISSDGGGTPVSGAGTIASATDQISGLDLSPLSDGTVTLSVALTDPAGNTGANATDTKLKDVAVPTATLAGPITPQADPFIATLTFSEVVTGLDLTSVALVNGTASALTGSGTDYSFTVTPDHDGTVEIALDAGAAADAAGNLSDAARAINVTTDLTGTPNPTPLPDADGDGVADILETGDRDGDAIPDDQDFDPQGYFYCEDDGRIIPGGGFTVSGPSGSNGSLGTLNDINITRDGTTGEIQWFALRPGTYSMSLSYPTAVGIPSTARLSSGTLDLTTLLPANPAVIGSSEIGATGFLADTSLGANPAFYTSFVIEPGDPFVLSNNIPMTQCAENLVTVTASTDGAEANAGAPTDATFTITQGRVSTVDTVISYTVAGSATSGTDFTALSGTVTIPAGATSATITVPVLEDGEIEGSETVEITLTGVTAGDLTTVLGTTVTRSANIADDDFADIAVVNVDLVTNEGGGDDATMTFALLGTPTSPVTLRFAGDSQCSVSPASMTFTSADYAVPQALTIRAIDDDKVEGTHSCQPTVVVSSGDTRYDGAPLALATVTVTDDLVDQIREPLTEILEDDLKETITTQTKAFSRMAKGALQRLQAGRDLHCGTIEGFDVDGSVQVQDGTGAARGTFGRDAYNCVTETREILDGTFSLNKTEDTGVQALLQFAWQRERFISDEALSGYFLGGYYSRTDVSGLGDGSIDGFGVNGGLYGARSFAEGLFLDYYVAGAAGRHTFDIDFDAAAAPINATGQYSYLAGFAGVGVSGERAFDSFVMKPRVGLDLSYAKAGDADVTATQLGLSHDGVIDLDDFSGVRATAEIRFESLAAPGGAEALAGMMRTAFTPRFVCELSSYDDATNCGVGLAFAWERTDAASGLTWGLEVDVEQIDDNRRFTFNIKRERPVANGRGAIVTRLSMPEAETLQLEHGLKLDF